MGHVCGLRPELKIIAERNGRAFGCPLKKIHPWSDIGELGKSRLF
jgi:hypothetical protein